MQPSVNGFSGLGLPEPLLQSVTDAGYETPSPIQQACIPLLLEGEDLVGQAQTGTGKTAAFALPLLARVRLQERAPQLLVLTPTRELAIQVAEAMQVYAHHLPDFHVLPIYGGQAYDVQLRHLKRGVHVIVGTPGRVMDHMRRGTLKTDRLHALVLDEADEMLRMGFIDDVNWVLEHIPEERQIALFSATMPKAIREVASRHLRDPKEISIKSSTATAATIHQRYWVVSGMHKLDALTRVLETETIDAALVFVRTRTATVELADKLAARGFSVEALNGDIAQAQREKTVDRLRNGRIDLLVATDVVARGLDVQRISHVINYDIPYDSEAYVHRIGRTGRAGRSGEAILFAAPRERRMLKVIERATGQPMEPMDMPSIEDVNESRLARFKQRILDEMAAERDLGLFYRIVRELEDEQDADPLQIAAVLGAMLQGDTPLLLQAGREPRGKAGKDPKAGREERGAPVRRAPSRESAADIGTQARPLKDDPEVEMERYRVAVGAKHGVKPGNIVGAIANEADLESRYIGYIGIFEDFSIVDLPSGMPKETFRDLKKARVCGERLEIARFGADHEEAQAPGGKGPKRKSAHKRKGKPKAKDRRKGQ